VRRGAAWRFFDGLPASYAGSQLIIDAADLHTMPLVNSVAGYGALTKLFHLLVALLIVLQYTSANIMLRTPTEATTFGLDPGTYYNWHKPLGLVVFLFMLARLANRRVGKLLPWVRTLTPLEQTIMRGTEQLLYGALLIMPLSGFSMSWRGTTGSGCSASGICTIRSAGSRWSPKSAYGCMWRARCCCCCRSEPISAWCSVTSSG